MKQVYLLPLAAAMIGLAIIAGFSMGAVTALYVYVLSVFIILLLNWFILFTRYPLKTIFDILSQAFINTEYDEMMARDGLIFFRILIRTLIILGCIALVVGILPYFSFVESHGRLQSSSSFSLLFSSICWFFLSLFCIPFQTALKEKIERNG